MERRSYTDLEYWKKYLSFLPEKMRFTDDVQPDEEWWQWRGNDIHVDRLRSPGSKCKFIFLHGGGGNGRLLGTIGACFYRLGYEYLALDLPGFGLTLADKASRTNYAAWVDLVSDLVDRECREDGRPGPDEPGFLQVNNRLHACRGAGIVYPLSAPPGASRT